MSRVRTFVLAVGVLLTLATVGFVVYPSLAAGLPVEELVETLGGDYVFVAVFGAVAVFLLLVAMMWRGVEGLDQTTPPNPEDVQTVPLFGSDFDDVTGGAAGLRERFVSDRPALLRERVRDVAVTAEMRAEGCSRSEAERRIASGSWTSDPEAAAFLSDETGPSPPLSGRVRAAVRGKAWFQRGARRAAERVVERTEGVSNR